jgi:hypothetical protein
MQKLLFLLSLWYLPQFISAQVCANPQSQMDIQGNKLKARILNGGDLFTDFSSGQFIPNPTPGGQNPSTIFTAGLWLGGVDPGGNLKLAASDYRNNNSFDFSAGPLKPDGTTDGNTCSNWDRHFRVTDDRIVAFLASLPLTADQLKSLYPEIAGWPGMGNPHFEDVNGFSLPNGQGLAPFYDGNSNGIYDPLNGDYPAVLVRGMFPFVPAEVVWCVFNDQKGGGIHSASGGKPLQMEIQLTTWTFDCPDVPVLDRTLFTVHKFINRASDNCDSTFVGIWADIDLGCYLDDYVGCSPELSTIFAYNQDAVDGQPGSTCLGTPTFGDTPPVQTISFLNRPLDKFNVPNSTGSGNPPGTTDPQSAIQYYNYLTGSWRDGSPITQGGNGYGGTVPVDHHYPDDPSDPNGWSMCSELIPVGDVRLLGSSKLGLLQPGEVDELVMGWAFHTDQDLPCGLGSAMEEVQVLRNIYAGGFDLVCSALSTSVLPKESIRLMPNPASTQVLVQHKDLAPTAIRMVDVQGRVVLEQTAGFGQNESTVNTAGLSSGLYTLQLSTHSGIVSQKLAIVR